MKKYAIILLLIIDLLIFYLFLPVISIKNFGLWVILLLNLVMLLFIYSIFNVKKENYFKGLKAYLYVLGALVLIICIGALASSKLFNAKRFSNLLKIETVEHVNLPNYKELKQIPLMDTESSKVLGNRKIGALNNIVSQFEVADEYMTISYNDQPVKVSALKYADLWKWFANKSNGIPGYVLVKPNDLNAEYVEIKEGMKYVPSAYFSQDLARHIYFKYPFTFFDNVHFEIDDNGHPYYVASTFDYTIGLFGGKKINGAIVVDAVNGNINKYDLNNIPEWLDIVFNGDYIAKYFDIYGRLTNGYFNSIFGQKGLVESTTTTFYDSDGDSYRDNDFGYLIRDNKVLIYTGVTAVTNDESNIGYLLANEATGEVKISYFEATDEDSVMRAAEGEVQEKGYRASFPSLIDINGTPAYAMVLKDNLGLVKMYAIVDAAQYSHMIVNDSLDRAISLFSNGNIGNNELNEKNIVVKRIEFINIDGNSYIYLVDNNNNIYQGEFNKDLLLVNEGDSLTILTDGELFKLK